MDKEDIKEFFKPDKWKIVLAVIVFMFLPVILAWAPVTDVSYAEYITPIFAIISLNRLLLSIVPLFGIIIAYAISCVLIHIKRNFWQETKELFRPDTQKIILTVIFSVILFAIGMFVLPWQHGVFSFETAFDPLVYHINTIMFYSFFWITGMMTSTMLITVPNRLFRIPYNSGNPIGSTIFGLLYDSVLIVLECYILSCLLITIYRNLKNKK